MTNMRYARIHLILIWDVKKQSFNYWIFSMPSEGGGEKRKGIMQRFHILRAGWGLQEKGVVYNMLVWFVLFYEYSLWRTRVRVTRKRGSCTTCWWGWFFLIEIPNGGKWGLQEKGIMYNMLVRFILAHCPPLFPSSHLRLRQARDWFCSQTQPGFTRID